MRQIKREEETSKIDEGDRSKYDEMAEFEKTQTEEKASTRSKLIGQELNSTNIQLYIIQLTKANHGNFSASDLRAKILEIEPETDIKQ